jgi:hypothetical protein
MPKLRITYPEVVFKTIEIVVTEEELPNFLDVYQNGNANLISVGPGVNVTKEARCAATITVLQDDKEKTTAVFTTMSPLSATENGELNSATKQLRDHFFNVLRIPQLVDLLSKRLK